MKILILGTGGLGTALAETFKDIEPILWGRRELDITRAGEVRKKITGLRPDVIINAAAFTDVNAAETTGRTEALAVNAIAVGTLAETARNLGAAFIHYSTDYVFKGDSHVGYKETDLPGEPLNYYGLTKLEGERLMLKAYDVSHEALSKASNSHLLTPIFYLIRTSWLFGKAGKSFPAAMLKLAETHPPAGGPELEVVYDQHGKPTYALDLARATRALIEEAAPSGIYHLTNEPAMTWYDLARLVFETKKALDPAFKVPLVRPIPASQFPSRVKRPEYSILLNTKRPALRHIREALKEYLK